ncbi:MAG: bifunctional phosphoribosylaminoimidazolecarboxamide formyltransferase/IMP cyclohydrolase, partial [Gemmatimonadota bacterium]
MPTAILSVSDKTGLAEFGSGLVELGWTIVSTGGTARVLRETGLDVRDVSELTGHPEMMDGRVKTLHPAVHAGLLARRDRDDDMAALAERGYGPIDLVAVNLYPFEEAAARGAPVAEAMEQVDIGGPTMLRAAAKNHASVLAVVDPVDYGTVLDALARDAVDDAMRSELARKVFAHTARYDAAIAGHLAGAADVDGTDGFPERMVLHLDKVEELRYGENPDQPAAFYAEPDPPSDALPNLVQLHGKALSFNNLVDIDAAVFTVSAWTGEPRAACAIMKHTTPCGV